MKYMYVLVPDRCVSFVPVVGWMANAFDVTDMWIRIIGTRSGTF
jgi:hypothetical protein